MLFSGVCFLMRFTVPGIDSLLWSKPEVQSEAVDYPRNSSTAIAQLVTSFLVYCVGKSSGGFSPSAADNSTFQGYEIEPAGRNFTAHFQRDFFVI